MKDKDNTLAAKWSKKENDIMIYYPNKCDGALLNNHLFHPRDSISCHPFIKELERRGYDITTLKFSVKKKKELK